MLIPLSPTESIAFNGILVASQLREAEIKKLQLISANQLSKFMKILGHTVPDNYTVTVTKSDEDGYPTEIDIPSLPKSVDEITEIFARGPSNGELCRKPD